MLRGPYISPNAYIRKKKGWKINCLNIISKIFFEKARDETQESRRNNMIARINKIENKGKEISNKIKIILKNTNRINKIKQHWSTRERETDRRY